MEEQRTSLPDSNDKPKKESTVEPAVAELFDELKQVSDGLLTSSHENFSLLTKMNEMTASQYSQSADELEKSGEVLGQVFEKLQLFQPHFDQIEQIEFSISNLESLAKSLDDYSKLLELRFKRL